MAIYFLNLKNFGRSGGSSAVSAAAYRAGERIRDERTGKTYDHSDRQDVMHKEIILPGDGDWTQAKIFAEPGVDVREDIYGVVRQNNWPLRELSRVKATLEEAFVELTQE